MTNYFNSRNSATPAGGAGVAELDNLTAVFGGLQTAAPPLDAWRGGRGVRFTAGDDSRLQANYRNYRNSATPAGGAVVGFCPGEPWGGSPRAAGKPPKTPRHCGIGICLGVPCAEVHGFSLDPANRKALRKTVCVRVPVFVEKHTVRARTHALPRTACLKGSHCAANCRNSRTPCGCCGVAVVAAVDCFHGNKKTPPPNLAGVRVDGLGSGQTAACSRAWAFFLSSRNRARKTARAANTPRLGMIQTMNQLRVVKTPSALCLGSSDLA